MCYKGKCLYCLKVETGSLIFAIINIIIVGLSGILVVGVTVYINIMIAADVAGVEKRGYDKNIAGILVTLGMASNAVLEVILFIIILSFTFAILLIKGLVTKNAGYVKAYFIFGTVQNVIAFIVTCVLVANCNSTWPALVGCFIYSLILVMIHMTYTKILNGTVLQNGGHRLLMERSCQ